MKWFSRSLWLSGGVFFFSYVVPNSFFPSYALSEVTTTLEEKKSATTKILITQQPNQERYQPEKLPPLPAPETKPVLSPPNSDSAQPFPDHEQSETKIYVEQVEVLGSTVFSSEELNLVIENIEGKSVTLKELKKSANAITQEYIKKGYVTSRAILVEQDITDGVVQIQVIEGRLEEIRVEGTKRLNPDYIRSRIKPGTKSPLRTDLLENQLLLLKSNPIIKDIKASLKRGKKDGESILVVQVQEENSFTSNFSFDNFSPPILGSERIGLELGYRNLITSGDDISGSYQFSTTGGSDIFDFNYSVPFNAMDGTLQLGTFLSRSEFTNGNSVELSSDYDIYQIGFRQPVIRSNREEFALSLGFSYRNGQPLESELSDLEEFNLFDDTEVNTSVINFGQEYVRRDLKGAWALRSQLNLGTGLFDATVRDDPDPDSLFFSWLFQGQRLHRFSDNNLLIISADLQLSPDSLLASEQFILGGGQSLRGYRQNVRFGDNGFRFSVEDRISIIKNEGGISTLQLAPFVDLGKIWNNPDNPTSIPDQRFLASAGLGLIVQPIPSLTIRLDYGAPFIDLDDRGDNLQDDGFYFSVNLQP